MSSNITTLTPITPPIIAPFALPLLVAVPIVLLASSAVVLPTPLVSADVLNIVVLVLYT